MYGYIGAVFFFIWLIILTYIVYKTKKHYSRLTQRTKGHKIDDILDALLEHDKLFQTEFKKVQEELRKMETASRSHFQKIGVVRFNPFGRASSDQSFVVSLLDGEDRGITMNFIYTHEGIRVYTKKIKDGKGDTYELSEEELHAIKNAGSTKI